MKSTSEESVSEILKPLTGRDFDRHRAAILGLGKLLPADVATVPDAKSIRAIGVYEYALNKTKNQSSSLYRWE